LTSESQSTPRNTIIPETIGIKKQNIIGAVTWFILLREKEIKDEDG